MTKGSSATAEIARLGGHYAVQGGLSPYETSY